MLVQSLDNAVRNRKQNWLQVAIVSLTRQIVNLISSIKIYVDHVKKRHVTKLPLDKDRQIELLEELSDCEKNSTSYKFIKNLRNYVVHRSLPIDSYTAIHSWEKIESEDEEKLGHVIKPFVKKEKLLSDRKFSTTIVKKIAGNDEKIDLRFPIRKTIARLSKFNENFREKISSDYDEAKKIIRKTIDRYHELTGVDNKSCKAFKETEGNKEVILLSERHFDRIELYYSRNKNQGILERRYIHNRV